MPASTQPSPPAPWPALGAASPDPAATYARDGAAALGRVLDDDQLARARAALDATIPECGASGPYATIVHDGWRASAELAALVPHVGAIACAVSGIPALVLFHDHLLCKPSGGDDMAWHQDFTYLPLDRAGGVTLWVAFDDVTEDNGCLYYVLGSHHLGERRAAWGITGDDDPRAGLPPIDVPADEPGVAAPTAAGCAIAHHPFLWHRSPGHASELPRRTWVLSFVDPDARWSPRHAPHPRSAVAPRAEGQPLEDDLLRVAR